MAKRLWMIVHGTKFSVQLPESFTRIEGRTPKGSNGSWAPSNMHNRAAPTTLYFYILFYCTIRRVALMDN